MSSVLLCFLIPRRPYFYSAPCPHSKFAKSSLKSANLRNSAESRCHGVADETTECAAPALLPSNPDWLWRGLLYRQYGLEQGVSRSSPCGPIPHDNDPLDNVLPKGRNPAETDIQSGVPACRGKTPLPCMQRARVSARGASSAAYPSE